MAAGSIVDQVTIPLSGSRFLVISTVNYPGSDTTYTLDRVASSIMISSDALTAAQLPDINNSSVAGQPVKDTATCRLGQGAGTVAGRIKIYAVYNRSSM